MNIRGIYKQVIFILVIFIILNYAISTTLAYNVQQEKTNPLSITTKQSPILHVVKYDKHGESFKTTQSISHRKAQHLLQLLDTNDANENTLTTSTMNVDHLFHIMQKAEVLPKSTSLDALHAEATKAFSPLKKMITDESSVKDIIIKALEKTDKHQLSDHIRNCKTNFLGRLKLMATGAIGKIGFTTRIPLLGRFGPPLPSITLALGSHTVLPGLGADVMLINAGPFLGDFTSAFNTSYSGLGFSGVTLGFVGWMMFLVIPGVYTYVWAVGFYGLNLWLGLFIAQ